MLDLFCTEMVLNNACTLMETIIRDCSVGRERKINMRMGCGHKKADRQRKLSPFILNKSIQLHSFIKETKIAENDTAYSTACMQFN